MMTSLHHMIIWQCDQDPVSYSVTEVFHYIGRLSRIFLSGKATFGSVLSLFSLLQGQKWKFLSKAVQCDMPLFSGSPTFGQKSLGGGTICFLLLFVHQLITFSTILLQLQRIKTTFFDVTLYGTVQIWGNLPISWIFQQGVTLFPCWKMTEIIFLGGWSF